MFSSKDFNQPQVHAVCFLLTAYLQSAVHHVPSLHGGCIFAINFFAINLFAINLFADSVSARAYSVMVPDNQKAGTLSMGRMVQIPHMQVSSLSSLVF